MDASNLPVANVVGTTFLWKQIYCAVEETTLTSPVSSPSSSRLQVQDTPAVAAAKAQHSALYGQIALSHAQVHNSLYESFSDVGEIRVWWRANFQSGYRVLKKVF